ncbi:Cytochrome P450 716B1 [Camellia lanceoleosa]|uniref:Cytochrome P450 716B1 n=1 Tax=Camellia lanceoleosa TaxID=1840588 RepID=A0ACC0GFZ9_9ERIC|nr:Cytochrome P450 716B1 [Camellia lanceoleosa]
MKTILMDLISEKRVALERNGASPCQDLITCLLCIRNEDNSSLLSDEETKDDAVIIMIGGYNTSSILFTFLIRFLANKPSIYAAIVEGMLPTSSLIMIHEKDLRIEKIKEY